MGGVKVWCRRDNKQSHDCEDSSLSHGESPVQLNFVVRPIPAERDEVSVASITWVNGLELLCFSSVSVQPTHCGDEGYDVIGSGSVDARNSDRLCSLMQCARLHGHSQSIQVGVHTLRRL